jgi:hypothetical protein
MNNIELRSLIRSILVEECNKDVEIKSTGTTENITMKKSEIKDFIQTELSEVLSAKRGEGSIRRAGQYSDKELKKIAQMTGRNQHLEARLFIAKKAGYEKHRKAYLALIALRDAMGHTPKGAERVRSDLDKDLRKYISKDYDNWKELWGNL